MKKILLVGGTGGLGNQLTEHLSLDYTCFSVGSKILDVTNEEQVKEFLDKNDYDIIIYLSVKNIDGLIHKQTKETAEALKLLRKDDLREAFKNDAVLKILQADELNLLEEKVKAELDAVDKLSDLPRQDAQRKREQIQRETAFQIDLIQKKKLNAGSEIAILTKKIADEKIQLLDREIFIANLAKAEKKSTDEQTRIFNEGLRKENEINKNNEAKQKKLVDFNDLIATKDEVILGKKLRGLKLTESQTEQAAKIVKDAQTNQIANDELIIKLQNDKIASLEKQFKIEQDIISLQKQSEIDIIKEQEAEKQRQLDLANQKIIEGENVNQKIMIDFRKQTYDETIKYLDLEYEAKQNQLKKLENAFDTESKKRPTYYGSQKGGIDKT